MEGQEDLAQKLVRFCEVLSTCLLANVLNRELTKKP